MKDFFGFTESSRSGEIESWRDSPRSTVRKAQLTSVVLALVMGLGFYFSGDGDQSSVISSAVIGLLAGTCLYQAWERGALKQRSGEE